MLRYFSAFLPSTRHVKESSNQLDMIHKQNLIMWTEGVFAVKYEEFSVQDQICECKSILVRLMKMVLCNFPLNLPTSNRYADANIQQERGTHALQM
jgi:hypothetical protein